MQRRVLILVSAAGAIAFGIGFSYSFFRTGIEDSFIHLRGAVVDEEGTPLPATDLVLSSASTGHVSHAHSDTQGCFDASRAGGVPGRYRISVAIEPNVHRSAPIEVRPDHDNYAVVVVAREPPAVSVGTPTPKQFTAFKRCFAAQRNPN